MAAETPIRRNVFVLATCQMLFGSSRTLLIATTPVIALGNLEGLQGAGHHAGGG